MKRSEINRFIAQAIDFFRQMNFSLPPWAYWNASDWKNKYLTGSEIVENMLGWDLTDFGGGKFYERGLVLFTIRNGNLKKDKKTYCEKIMIAEVGQETPLHFHWIKIEDIINRGGGELALELYKSTNDGGLSEETVRVKIDGIQHEVMPGKKLLLKPGESICLEPRVYHRFWGEKEKVLIGEVSSVNDDAADNRFYEPVGRFPEIEEDEEPHQLLVSDYRNFL